MVPNPRLKLAKSRVNRASTALLMADRVPPIQHLSDHHHAKGQHQTGPDKRMAKAGGGLASNRTHHDPSALHRHHFDRGAALDESAFGDHVHPLAVDAGGA